MIQMVRTIELKCPQKIDIFLSSVQKLVRERREGTNGERRKNVTMVQESNSIKVMLVGDGGVGKTTYVKRLLTGEFERKYDPTMGAEVHPFRQDGQTFNLWERAGQEKFDSLGKGYYIGAKAAIVMFDVTSRLSYRSVAGWIKELEEAGIENIVVCGNKVDSKDRKVFHRDILVRYPYVELSTKSCYNFEKPFQTIMEEM